MTNQEDEQEAVHHAKSMAQAIEVAIETEQEVAIEIVIGVEAHLKAKKVMEVAELPVVVAEEEIIKSNYILIPKNTSEGQKLFEVFLFSIMFIRLIYRLKLIFNLSSV